MVPRRLSVVIPAFNNAQALTVTLASLTRQTMPTDQFEVVVADDGSAVPLAAAVDQFADRIAVSCVRSEHNRGRAAIRNFGAARTQSDLLLFLDSDSVAHPALLDRHAAFHEGRGARLRLLAEELHGIGTVRRGLPLRVRGAGRDGARRLAAVCAGHGRDRTAARSADPVARDVEPEREAGEVLVAAEAALDRRVLLRPAACEARVRRSRPGVEYEP